MGWREWVALPGLGVPWVKAKVDTGARSSAIHAFDVETFHRRDRPMVRFKVHPLQRDARRTIEVEAEIIDQRHVRPSAGLAQRRLVIRTDVEFGGVRWPIELTLANRDSMGFRMLLGREAIRGRFLVDPGRSFLGGRPPKDGRPRRPKPKKEPKKKGRS